MTPPSVEGLRRCLEGGIPSLIATCARDGTPNVTYVSQVNYVDARHVALSFQFFNKTRENILANPLACVYLIDPSTAGRFRLALRYLRTETEGPLFESMKAKLAGIASYTGMAGVFRLLGSDVYEVLAVERLAGAELPEPTPRSSLLPALREWLQRVAACHDLAGLLDETVAAVAALGDVGHAMVLMADETARRLYAVASRGYAQSGVGAEIAFGEGVVGVAAACRTPIRIAHFTEDYAYSRALRESAEREGFLDAAATEIPLPGLPGARSRIAVPMLYGGRVLGVLYAESAQDMRFGYDEEDALASLAVVVAVAAHNLQQAVEIHDEATPASEGTSSVVGSPVEIRRFAANDSVFVGEDYLIKGVAGAIFWKLLRDYVERARTDFSNRELRLDPSIRLPDLSDNLEARLILLQRRLAERAPFLRIEKTGRGRFRLVVSRPVRLVDVAAVVPASA